MASMTRPTSNRAARALGWLSIGLGVTELAGAGRMLGLVGGRRRGIARLYGLREVATGIGLLTAANPVPWVWGRVGGDALDMGSLLGRFGSGTPRKGSRALALMLVALIGALDLGCAQGMRRRR